MIRHLGLAHARNTFAIWRLGRRLRRLRRRLSRSAASWLREKSQIASWEPHQYDEKLRSFRGSIKQNIACRDAMKRIEQRLSIRRREQAHIFQRQANHMKRQLRAWPTIPASQADFMAHCRRLKHKFECNKVQMQLATPPEVLNPRDAYKAQMRFELLNSQPQNHVESCSPDPESESESWSDCFDISPSW